MPEIIIDEEFRNLLPALDGETYAWLEESILENGCWAPLVLWDGILIDGHNRYEICVKHDVTFNTIDMEFDSRDGVLVWIISTQVARRNMTPFQLSYYRGLHYMADKRVQGTNNQYVKQSESGQSDPFQGRTASRLAMQYKVSPKTIRRDAVVAEAISAIGRASPDAMRSILSGNVSISRKQLKELADGPEDGAADIAARIDDGEFKRGQATRPSAGDGIAVNGPEGSGMHPLGADFFKVMEGFSSDMRRLFISDGEEGLKTVFRSYMDRLEDLYERL